MSPKFAIRNSHFEISLANALDVIFIPIVCLIVLMTVGESPGRYVLMSVTSAVYTIRLFMSGYAVRPNLMDVSLLAVVIVETVSYLTSSYRPNSANYLYEVLFLFLFYCAVRSGLRRDYQRVALFVFLLLLGFWVSSRALYSFWLHWRRLDALGFTDLTSFKHLFGLVGPDYYSTGERITLILLLLPFPFALMARFHRSRYAIAILVLPAVVMLAALAVTFSRGVYMGIAAFFVFGNVVSWRLRSFTKKSMLTSNAAVILLTILVLGPVLKPVMTTAVMFDTRSQVRSFEGRTEIWRSSLSMAARHPLYGIGALNFPMQYSSSTETQTAFITSAYDYFLEILIEKGVAGLAVYLMMFSVFFWMSVTRVRRLRDQAGSAAGFHSAILILSAAACCGVLVRDLTFSSLLINKGAAALLWFGFANVASLE